MIMCDAYFDFGKRFHDDPSGVVADDIFVSVLGNIAGKSTAERERVYSPNWC